MPGVGDLTGLTLSTVGSPVHFPMVGVPYRITAVPELRRYAGICGIAQHTSQFAILYFVADFCTELEIVALIVDRPGAIGLHVYALVSVCDHIFEIPIPRLQIYIGHADQGCTVPT